MEAAREDPLLLHMERRLSLPDLYRKPDWYQPDEVFTNN